MTDEKILSDLEDSDPEDLLPANILANLVMCDKKHTIALDVLSDKFCIIVYERRIVEKPKHKQKGPNDSKTEKWVRAAGPFQASISQALHKVREMMRKRDLAEVKSLDKLIEHEARITKEVFECFETNFKQFKAAVKEMASKSSTDADKLSKQVEKEPEQKAPQVLSSEELFAAKKANALSTGPKRRGRPAKAK